MAYTHFNVAPRYSGGSPAMVPAATAHRVAVEEKEGYYRHRSGVYGEENRTKALTLGMRGIVEQRTERAGCWIVKDLLTLEMFVRPFPPNTYGEKDSKRQAREQKLKTRYALPLEAEITQAPRAGVL